MIQSPKRPELPKESSLSFDEELDLEVGSLTTSEAPEVEIAFTEHFDYVPLDDAPLDDVPLEDVPADTLRDSVENNHYEWLRKYLAQVSARRKAEILAMRFDGQTLLHLATLF